MLSLTIDEEKVRKCLATVVKPEYVVTISQLTSVAQPNPPAPSLAVSGTMMYAGAGFSADAKKHLAALRRRIEASGVSLKTADELDREIDELKGRK